ncbi:MAG: hypothetical protein IJO65_00390 [Lachnospiraceae bacterium]|nr:hypothetical protein [Lachnospiraceae bacterium]
MLKIGTVLFTYKRINHTKKVLEALSKNTVLPQKLYIFQDGLKKESDKEDWEKVNELIHTVDFCPVELHVSKENKGLTEAILSGINYVLEENDAVIVIEDDIMVMPGFMKFMTESLVRYEKEEKVYHVTGYNLPLDLSRNGVDAYFGGRANIWGWGTWKNRWGLYDRTDLPLREIMNNSELSKELAIWGRDLDNVQQAVRKGEIDTWDVFWALTVIKNRGYCLNPCISLVKNIGFDNSGEHCSAHNRYDTDELQKNVPESWIWPEKINFEEEVRKAYVNFFGSGLIFSEYDSKKNDVLIYGLGNCFHDNEKEIVGKYNVVAIIDSYKRGWFAGKRIIEPAQIDKFQYDSIIIMLYDEEECKKIAENLEEKYNVPKDKIIIYWVK